MSSLLKIGGGIKNLKHNIKEYDRLILCGPIWMGSLIAPLRNFIKKYKHNIKNLYFVTCCGSTDDKKDDKFGYAHVFSKIKNLMEDKAVHYLAFPIALVLPEDKVEDGDTIMNTRLTDQNFKGRIQERYEDFIDSVSK